MTKNNTKIQGFTIKGATGEGKAGIYLHGGTIRDCKIYWNFLTGNYDGIAVSGTNCKVENNIADENEIVGMRIGGENNIVRGNAMSLNGIHGAWVLWGKNNTFRDNLMSGNVEHGICLENSEHNVIEENEMSSNFKSGICVHGAGTKYNTISKNKIERNVESGIYLMEAEHITIADNEVSDNTNTGVYLSESCYNTISGNDVSHGVGYEMGYKRVEQNNGICLNSNSKYNTISDNDVSCNPSNGICLAGYSEHNTVSNNVVMDNGCEFLNKAHTSNGICLSKSSENTVTENNVVGNTRQGIYLTRSDYSTITGNDLLENNLYGLYLFKSSNLMVKDNIFTEDGLFVYDSYRNTVTGNTVNKRPLVYLEDKSSTSVTSSTNPGQVVLVNCKNIRLENLDISFADCGIELWKSHNCKLSGNRVTENIVGICLLHSNSNTITGNEALYNRLHGILVTEASQDNTVDDNEASNNEYSGIDIYGSGTDKNTVINNKVLNNDVNGILMVCARNNVVRANEASHNGQTGIILTRSRNNIITDNKAVENGWHGFKIYVSRHNTYTGNIASNNNGLSGFWLDDAAFNTFVRNDVSDNKLILRSSSRNTFYLNTFDNVVVDLSWSGGNFWNSKEELNYTYKNRQFTSKVGNYWSDYAGDDANDDGIGDTPHMIKGGKKPINDDFPMMHTPSVWYEIRNFPPIASFSFSPEDPVVYETVTFDAFSSHDIDGRIVSYQWSYGDGTTGEGEVTTHSFSKSGNYTVNLTVKDDKGAKDTTSRVIHIAASAYVEIEKWVKYKEEPDSEYRKAIDGANVCNNVTFKIAVHNDGNVTNLTSIGVVDTLSCSLGYINGSANIPPTTYENHCPDNQTLTWIFAELWLEPGEYLNITFDAHVDECGNDTNYVRVEAENETGYSVSDEDTVWVNCTPPGTPVETATGSGTVYFATDAWTLEGLAAVDEATLPDEGKPALVFPHGFFSFNITGLTPGQTVVVTVTLPDNVSVGTEYWKYHASEGGWIQIPMGSDDGDAVITITLVDGGLGDDDGAANGVIVDQGGPGIPGAPPVITSFAPPSPINDTVCHWRTFNVTVNQTVNVSWYLNESFLFTNTSVREASCTRHAEVVGEHNVSAIASNANGTDIQTWIWNVTAVSAPPNITSFAPPSPVNDTVCTWRTFNVTVNQTVNVSWYLNNTLRHTNVSTKEANFTLHAEVIGEHNVSAKAENENGTDMQTWVWNVTAAPLPILEINKTDNPDPVSPGGILNYSICMNNTGNVTATNVIVTETYDENVTFLDAVPAPSQGSDMWQFATLNVGESKWINISVAVNASVLNETVLHNIVNVTCDEGVSDSDTEDTTVLSLPVCIETATGTGIACFETDAGTIEDLVAVDESTLPAEGKPALVFPHGFFSFNITGLTPGQTVVVTITLPDNVSVGTEYWKYHASEGGWIQILMDSGDGDEVITITLEDGGLGDDDGAANGVIVDQGGPGIIPKPDLVIEEIWTKERRDRCKVYFVVKNIGCAPAPKNHHATLLVNDQAVEEKRVRRALRPGEQYESSFRIRVSCTGDFDTIRVCADDFNVVDELDETNNCLENKWICEMVGKPDLLIKKIWEKDSRRGTYKVKFEIKNIGTAPTPRGVRHYAVLFVDGERIEQKTIRKTLESGEIYKSHFRTRITCSEAFDTIEVCADWYNDIDELNEENNCLEKIHPC